MNIVAWILFGAMAGFVAHYSDTRAARGGLKGAVALGIAGSLTGGYVANLFFGNVLFPFDLPSFILAIVGSLLVLLVHRTVFTNASPKSDRTLF